MLDGSYWFECICAHDEHTIRFTLDKEDKEIYTSVFLANHRNFFVRIILGIKYIFGGKSRYGYFGNWVLAKDDVDMLEKMLKEFKDGTS
jgi:hypothetical protein